MLKMQVDKVRMHITTHFRVNGSVLADSIQGEAVGIDTHLEIDSPEPPAKVVRLIRNAERGCFVMQALLKPVPITSTTSLNGQPLAGT
jgi:organic hydroperoxide reductase OsmC/OhrA